MVREPHLKTSSGLQKSNLLVIDEKLLNVIDVQIQADSMVDNLDAFYSAQNTPLEKALKDRYEGKAIKVFCHVQLKTLKAQN